MINICVNYQDKTIEIEGEKPVEPTLEHMEFIIKTILNKAYYGGERICLETKNENGFYHEVERWSTT